MELNKTLSIAGSSSVTSSRPRASVAIRRGINSDLMTWWNTYGCKIWGQNTLPSKSTDEILTLDADSNFPLSIRLLGQERK
jgi:hypothetical protein